jgi:hypothetical protein
MNTTMGGGSFILKPLKDLSNEQQPSSKLLGATALNQFAYAHFQETLSSNKLLSPKGGRGATSRYDKGEDEPLLRPWPN